MSHAPNNLSQMPAGCSGTCEQGRCPCDCDREERGVHGGGIVRVVLIVAACAAVAWQLAERVTL